MDTGRFAGVTAGPDDSGAGPASLTRQPLQVLAIGRLTYYKGFEYLLRAVAKAPGIHVHLVGEGDQSANLRSLTATLNIEDRVTFHGALSNPDLTRKYAACDCLCLPSIERTEAFGMVLLEAMYFGKAAVIGDVEGSGMGWVVDDGVTGIKVRPADADALAGALLRLSANREELALMGRAGRRKFAEQFDIDESIKGLLDVYHRI